MEDHILLAHLQALLGRAPDFSLYSATSQEHLVWLGQAHALVSRWDRMAALSLRTASDHLSIELIREQNVAQIFGVLHRAVADLELRVPTGQQQAFGPGEVYDFFNALRRVIASAERHLFIIDPYLDASIIEQYLHSRGENANVRLLLARYGEDVKPALERYTSQHGVVLEARRSTAIHDRIVFVDYEVCWVLGQSIKDAAKAKPTYLAPLPPDVTITKLGKL